MTELIGVLDALDEYTGEIIADFRRFYGISAIAALSDGDFSIEEIIALVQNLPSEGAYARAISKDLHGWNEDRILLMSIANELKILNYHFLLANGQKNAKKPKLLSPPVPDEEKPSEESLEIEARMLAQWRAEEQEE